MSKKKKPEFTHAISREDAADMIKEGKLRPSENVAILDDPFMRQHLESSDTSAQDRNRMYKQDLAESQRLGYKDDSHLAEPVSGDDLAKLGNRKVSMHYDSNFIHEVAPPANRAHDTSRRPSF